jgi:pyruvate/2-oxoglutarate dehydrogenase complex dihydrolipoamide acyltransferase (E2) component
MMSATLAFDHRFIHGADATRFINTLDALPGESSPHEGSQ